MPQIYVPGGSNAYVGQAGLGPNMANRIANRSTRKKRSFVNQGIAGAPTRYSTNPADHPDLYVGGRYIGPTYETQADRVARSGWKRNIAYGPRPKRRKEIRNRPGSDTMSLRQLNQRRAKRTRRGLRPLV